MKNEPIFDVNESFFKNDQGFIKKKRLEFNS